MENRFQCFKCGHVGVPWICPGTCSGRVVDILDYGCESCNSTGVEFVGSIDQRLSFWDYYYDNGGTPELNDFEKRVHYDRRVKKWYHSGEPGSPCIPYDSYEESLEGLKESGVIV